MRQEVDLAAYEGLIFSTAKRYVEYLDDDLDDIRQVLRVKVWQALVAFDSGRSRLHAGCVEDARNSFVFSCVRNRVKDLLKEQDRRNTRRNGTQWYIEDLTDDLGSFEGRYLAEEDPALLALVDGEVELPSTLTTMERELVGLLLLDCTRGEIAAVLGITRKRVLATHKAVRVKMQDWKPTSQSAVVVQRELAAAA